MLSLSLSLAFAVETEADDFLVAFHTVEDAARAAFEMKQVTEAHNKTVKEVRLHSSCCNIVANSLGALTIDWQEHFKVLLGGLGIDVGMVVQEKYSGKFFGEAADGSFELGELLLRLCALGDG